VTDVGREVKGIAEGDRVAIEPGYYCGARRPCTMGQTNICKLVGFHGLMADGGMAEYSLVPQHMIHQLPESVPVEMGALVEPMAVAFHAAQLGDVNDQSQALIFGGGPIGIGLWFALRGLGLTEIDVVEPVATRRNALEALGARTLDPLSVDVPAMIADRTNGDGVDAAYDAAGVVAAVASALECVGERRPLISVAIYQAPLQTPLLNLVLRERRIQGTLCYTADDYRSVIDLMARGHYDTSGWVDTIPIENVIEDGYEPLHAGAKMKLLVDPS